MSVSKSSVLVAGVASSTQIKMTPYKKNDSVEKCTEVHTFFLAETTFTSGVCKDLTQPGDVINTSGKVTLQADGTSIKWQFSQSKTCEEVFLPETIPLDTCYEDVLMWLKFEKVSGDKGGVGTSFDSLWLLTVLLPLSLFVACGALLVTAAAFCCVHRFRRQQRQQCGLKAVKKTAASTPTAGATSPTATHVQFLQEADDVDELIHNFGLI